MGQLDKWPGHPAVACRLVGLSSRLTKLTANIDNNDDSRAWTMLVSASASASVSAAVAALPCATLDNGSACSRQSNMGMERCTCAVTYICPVAFVAAKSSGGCEANHLAYGIRQTVYGQQGRKVKFLWQSMARPGTRGGREREREGLATCLLLTDPIERRAHAQRSV